MKTNKSLLILLISTALVLAAVYILVKKDKVKWTAQNSLHISDANITEDKGDYNDLLNAIENSLIYYSKIDQNTEFYFGEIKHTTADMIECLEDFRKNLNEYGLSDKFFNYINENYDHYKSRASEVLYTGYFEATLSGSLKRSERFRYPLYKKPDDLVRIELSEYPFYSRIEGLPKVIRGRIDKDNRIFPYYSRKDIDIKNKLQEKGLELVWVDSRIDLFFLQIQGSGIIKFDDGSGLRVNYAETNGHPYRAIGKFLVEKGVCTYEELSMQYIKKYLEEHPIEIDEIFNYNPSYIFFREVAEGPVGALGVIVTRYRSIATDKYIFPRGAICFIDTNIPEFDEKGNLKGVLPFRRFVLNQDTGGAIRSPGRADLFTGNGIKSELIAGHLKEEGELYFLIKKKGTHKIPGNL